MCGRFALAFISPEKLKQLFCLDQTEALPVSYNIAPSYAITAIREIDKRRFLSLLQWGLIPQWANDVKIGKKIINARSETVSEKPAFRQAIRTRRCIIPASGFYEWTHTPHGKTPYFISSQDATPLAFAGLWDTWTSPDGKVIESCVILTTNANSLVAQLHDRMPVILQSKDFNLWLDPTLHDPIALQHCYRPYPAEQLQLWPVSPLVNSPRHDSPDCLNPVPL